ncbi:hypothetical protein UXJ26_06300 [Burkholderia multivorans]|uniref:Bacteriophage protein n=1 Tax=Burkholderia multivorans (strain ATCC 17616 / 249) TaxID=395019 RepID=A0A0H3KVU5_BURM1|nr:hypothetical protein [Burkholderia multivorans]YP_355390.1 gp55 [Burkholderia phage Bcep176]ABA60056.1 gp55 [Burkholderia phage Bcep176]ABX17571.1 GP28 [Burkholderia multivorans ATCC 17616]MBU9420081.1 hypothetical protein [Burkholderia multivorans]PRF62473.1 hypothetical protein C6Q28_10890 [Burkholderia multivorans]BAG46464.1 bacteriophage protein [Burkholderia multivorans ATCC 17616]
MKKIIAALAIPLFLSLAACGGGDDSGPDSSGPAIKLTYSGMPLVTSQRARTMAAATDVSSSASAPGVPANDVQPTISALQDAFKARGADIAIYPGVINGSKLHDIVMSENNGVGPTRAEIAEANVNISSWTLVNFQYDDMTGYIDTPEKKAMADQFYKDIRIFAAREYVKGNVVFYANPIMSCLPAKIDSSGYSVATATQSLRDALAGSDDNLGHAIGGISPTPDQMGSDCQTPNSAAQASYVDSIADPLTEQYKTALDTINKCKYDPESIPEEGRWAQCWGIEPVKK